MDGHLARGPGNPRVFTRVAAFRTGTGQEANGTEFTGAPVVDGSYRITPALRAVEVAVAQTLPSAVAGPAGRPVGQERLGANSTEIPWPVPGRLDA